VCVAKKLSIGPRFDSGSAEMTFFLAMYSFSYFWHAMSVVDLRIVAAIYMY